MKIKHKILEYHTAHEFHFVDVSDEVMRFVRESGIKNGMVNVQTLHTTAGVLINENEPLLLEDLKEHLEEVASKTKAYRHDNMDIRTVNVCDDECANGHAHCKASHLCANATLNVINGKLQLGEWQRILFVELDRSRKRKLQVLVMGE